MKHILIVDGSEADRAAVDAALSGTCETVHASDGEEALCCLQDSPCDLILMDVDLPGMDGFEVMARIRLDKRLKDVPIVFLTYDASPETESRCLENGAVDYIVKPFSPVSIRSRLGRILEAEEMRRSLSNELREKIREVREIRDKSQQDPLTGLWNRAYIEKTLNVLAESGKRGALYMIDMDNFKVINDLYGHIAGDNVLRSFADVMRAHAGPEDMLCRIGGDEFVMLVDREGTARDLGKLASAVIADLEKSLEEQEFETHSSVSIGIALFPEDGGDFNTIYSAADKALYFIKQNGKGSYRFYNERRKCSVARDGNIADVRYIKEMLNRSAQPMETALLDMDGFRHIYRFLHRFMSRSSKNIQILLFTARSKTRVDPREADAALELLTHSIQAQFRRSDVSTRFSSRQVVTLLVGTSPENAAVACERILEDFNRSYSGPITVEYDVAACDAGPSSPDQRR